MSGFIDEYMLRLGASVDASGMARFQQALREASNFSEVSFGAIAKAGFKAQTEIVSGFAAIGTAALGMIDKVAMADQQYRLFALHMYMSKDAARGLKVAMDALDQPLENLVWDKELRERTQQLLADQRAMAPGGDFEGQMRKVRDIRFEFTRMEVEGQYLAMHVVNDFMKALGFGPDELLHKLQRFNNWVVHDLPAISEKIVSTFMPVWHDVEDVFKATWAAVQATALAFTNLVGLITGDDSIEGKTADFEKFAQALAKVAHVFAVVAEAIANMEELLAHLVSAMADVAHGNFQAAGDELVAAFADARSKAVHSVIFGTSPLYALGNAAIDKATGIGETGSSGTVTSSVSGDTNIHALIDKYAAVFGVDPAIAHAVAMHESGEHQFDKYGNPIRNPGSTATGAFQLLNGTARAMGVNSSDAEGNVEGGVKLLHEMLMRYHGNVSAAVGAYADGPGVMDKVLTGRATLSPAAQSEIAMVMRAMNKSGDTHIGSITVHVNKPGAVNADVARAVAAEVRAAQDKRTQRNLYEFQDLSFSY